MQLAQSSVIAFFLFAAFIVFVTVRGELSAYVGFFQKAQGQTGPTSDSVKSSAGDQLSQAQSTLNAGATGGADYAKFAELALMLV